MVNALQDVPWMNGWNWQQSAGKADSRMPPGVMNRGFLLAVFIMQSADCVNGPARYQFHLVKPVALDLTSHKQDGVQIAIEPDKSPAELISMERNNSPYLDNSHTIEIEAKGLRIRMNNAHPVLLKTLMDVLKESIC